jgi:hypothetical protein
MNIYKFNLKILTLGNSNFKSGIMASYRLVSLDIFPVRYVQGDGATGQPSWTGLRK